MNETTSTTPTTVSPRELCILYDHPEISELLIRFPGSSTPSLVHGIKLKRMLEAVVSIVIWVDSNISGISSRILSAGESIKENITRALARFYSCTVSRNLSQMRLVVHISQRRLLVSEQKAQQEASISANPVISFDTKHGESTPFNTGMAELSKLMTGARFLVIRMEDFKNAIKSASKGQPRKTIDPLTFIQTISNEDIKRLKKALAIPHWPEKLIHKTKETNPPPQHQERSKEITITASFSPVNQTQNQQKPTKQRSLLTQCILTPQMASLKLQELNIKNKPNQSGSVQSVPPKWFGNRKFFHAHTLQPVLWKEVQNGNDSDEEDDISWWREHRKKHISKFTHANTNECFLFNLWNSFVHSHPLLNDHEIVDTILNFVLENKQVLIGLEPQLLSFCGHLFSQRLIKLETIIQAMSSLD